MFCGYSYVIIHTYIHLRCGFPVLYGFDVARVMCGSFGDLEIKFCLHVNTCARVIEEDRDAKTECAPDLQVHDIEDLSKFGHHHTACPYFVSRKLAETAELVFCPYNYVVDPGIRGATGIELDGAVVIFDEGHNIEDVAREAGSVAVTKQEVEDALNGMIRPRQTSQHHFSFLQVEAALNKLHGWLVGTCGNETVVRQVEYMRFQTVWDGSEV